MYLGNWCLSAFLSTFQMLWWNWLCRVIAIESMVTFCTSNWSLPWPCLLLRWRWKLPQSLQSWSAWTERFFSLLDSHMIPIILFAEFTWLVILFCPGWRWSGWVWATTRISGHFSQTTRWFQMMVRTLWHVRKGNQDGNHPMMTLTLNLAWMAWYFSMFLSSNQTLQRTANR